MWICTFERSKTNSVPAQCHFTLSHACCWFLSAFFFGAALFRIYSGSLDRSRFPLTRVFVPLLGPKKCTREKQPIIWRHVRKLWHWTGNQIAMLWQSTIWDVLTRSRSRQQPGKKPFRNACPANVLKEFTYLTQVTKKTRSASGLQTYKNSSKGLSMSLKATLSF